MSLSRICYLDGYFVRKAWIGLLRLLVPSCAPYTLHLLRCSACALTKVAQDLYQNPP